ncbi:MAG TPA: copper resistance protein CopC, partial [Actinomycetota bacterium]|nr:copper resistance protein CopC [Actinomycetota bacterium]
MRLRRPPAAVALLAGLWLLATGPAAGAHGVLRASDPPGGASLAAPPHAVTLSFSEAPDLGLSSVHVLDTAGRALERGRPEPVPGRSLALRVPLGGLPAGTYTVSWKVVSRVDGHTTGGAYVFGVGVPPVAPPGARQVMTTRADAPSPVAVAGRWSFYWGLALLVGAAASGLAVFDRRLPGRPALLLTGAVVVAAGGLAAMVAGARSGAGVPLGTLLGSRVGHLLAWQAGALATAALAVVALLRRPGRAWPLAAVGVTAAGGLLAHALAGHAAAPSSLRGVNLATQWAHLLAVGAWVGGLPWLLAGLRGRDRAGQAAAAVRFSRLATACLAAVAVTGFVRAAEELGGWARLLDTAFGRVLDVKLALFGAL